jgi:DNA/RNA endonuclease YhcR with UshA esterase domain
MKIVISKYTDSVYKNRDSLLDLNLPIPDSIESLVWENNTGTINLSDGTQQSIEQLPDWANQSIAIFDTALANSLPKE